ncbi:MAG TPA: c-type cytochrome, partial [Ignavibacteriaceae bacterium]
MSEIKNYINDSIRKIKDNPGTIFGLLYPYVLVIIIAIGFLYISNLDNVAQQKVPPILGDTLEVNDLTEMPSKTVPPVDVFKVKEASPELISQGKDLYTTICASCHNTTGAGGGPASVGLNPAPRNLTSADGWKNGLKFSEIYTTLQDGIEGSAMISYDYLTPAERISII